ncbi:MAG: hypothetical protein JXD23_05600 [Spirochaetales bacterium]|nr:hypothetical protein [Spirochaetales bacterium]
MRVLKAAVIVVVIAVAAVTLFHGCLFRGAFFLGVPSIHAGRLLRFLTFGGAAIVCFVIGAGVRRGGLAWLRIVLFVAGGVLSVWAVVNLSGVIW